MEKAAQVMKRIPRIKFPQRHPKSSSGSTTSKIHSVAEDDPAVIGFFSKLRASATATTLGGKASLQPKRTPVSSEEIEAILLGGCFST